jgi:hypothetical protein
MNLHKEINFEVEICEHLAEHGWVYAEKDAADYDRQLALFPADVLAWVQENRTYQREDSRWRIAFPMAMESFRRVATFLCKIRMETASGCRRIH